MPILNWISRLLTLINIFFNKTDGCRAPLLLRGEANRFDRYGYICLAQKTQPNNIFACVSPFQHGG